jgi:predicted flap endonuclease-1-like 5' DNA nuclease
MDQTSFILIIAAAVVFTAIAVIVLLRGRRQHIDLTPTAPSRTIERPDAPQPAPSEPEGDGVADEAAAAIEDVVGQMLGIDAHHDRATDGGEADELTKLKGLGPKAASRLNELGIFRFEQVAGWTEDDIARIDGEMGAFKGRIVRDRWVEQARFLTAGDIAGFEEQFGKLGA